MKKLTHPDLITTTIQTKEGALYFKRWNFFRTQLPLEIDISTHILWKKINKNLNKIKK